MKMTMEHSSLSKQITEEIIMDARKAIKSRFDRYQIISQSGQTIVKEAESKNKVCYRVVEKNENYEYAEGDAPTGLLVPTRRGTALVADFTEPEKAVIVSTKKGVAKNGAMTYEANRIVRSSDGFFGGRFLIATEGCFKDKELKHQEDLYTSILDFLAIAYITLEGRKNPYSAEHRRQLHCLNDWLHNQYVIIGCLDKDGELVKFSSDKNMHDLTRYHMRYEDRWEPLGLSTRVKKPIQGGATK